MGGEGEEEADKAALCVAVSGGERGSMGKGPLVPDGGTGLASSNPMIPIAGCTR